MLILRAVFYRTLCQKNENDSAGRMGEGIKKCILDLGKMHFVFK